MGLYRSGLPAAGAGAALFGALLFGGTFIGMVSLVLSMAGRYYPTRQALGLA